MKTKIHTTQRGITLNVIVLCALLMAALGMPSSALAAAPINNDISAATVFLTVPDTKTMSEATYNDSTVAFDDPQASCTGFPYLHSVWYSFTPTSYGNATINTLGSNFDAVIAVWTGTRGNLTEVACDDDSAGNSQAETVVQMKAGTKYYIEVMQFNVNPMPPSGRPSSALAATDFMTLNLSFTSAPNVAAPGIKYDDGDPVFAYTGTWIDATVAKAYNGGFRYSRKIGNTSTVTFDGIQFKLYYSRSLSYGRLAMHLDGNATAFDDIDQKGVTAYQLEYISPVFPEGIHTVEFRHLTRYVSIDAIEIVGAPDAVPPATINDLTATQGAAYGAVDLAWTAVGDDDMTGAAMSYDLRYSTASPILNETDWNAATPVSGEPTPQEAGQPESMTLDLIPGTQYYFAIRALDEPADATPGNLSNSPGVVAPAPPPSSAGKYDDLFSGWVYFGAWLPSTGAFATSGHYQYSATAGNSALFVFNGTGFTFTYLVNSAGGLAEIRVDGAAVAQINMKSRVTLWKRLYTRDDLAPGVHTFQIIHLSGARIYVDEITIR
ncbi:MAG: hypothetical protein HFACDABA_02800 [Anaerolineales bacterium]|nr:hypothetical protein [Anaerolineales bacterium]